MAHSKKTFKQYEPGQTVLFPPNLSDLIDEHHPVRVVNRVIDQINLKPILERYKGGGTSSFHPRMMLKVLVYAYLRNIYSSRKIEAALQENIHFMWLAGMSTPDHNTINRFRGERLKDLVKTIFSEVVVLLVESGHVGLKDAYVDGTKIEANANRYTFVWGKAVKRNKERIYEQLEELWDYAESVCKEEMAQDRPADFSTLDPEEVRKTINKIDKNLKAQNKDTTDKKVRQKVTYAKKNWPDKLEEYQQKEEILGERNSFSKTDNDATFMRMKDDHMQNGQLKPGYNVQMTSKDQFITNYDLYQKTTDTTTLPHHLDSFREAHGIFPKTITADAGYGSEENYTRLEKDGIQAFVKYNYFHKEQKQASSRKDNLRDSGKLHFNADKNCLYCPMGQEMRHLGDYQRETSTGFKQTISRYKAKNCHGCPIRAVCHNQQGNRVIEVNHNLNRLKQVARKKLLSEEGVKRRKKRPADIEAVFGNLKGNKGFRRFFLRGLKKVSIEIGLLAIAHNLDKWARLGLKNFLSEVQNKPYIQYQLGA